MQLTTTSVTHKIPRAHWKLFYKILKMIFEIANLLNKPVGSSDCMIITKNHSSNKHYQNPEVTGTVNMIRTDLGIWISAILETSKSFECSRCLNNFSHPFDLHIEEEYIGQNATSYEKIRAKTYGNDRNFKINTKLQLDLSEAIKQYSLTSTPMKPICTETCLGICDQCGTNKNLTRCDCENYTIDSKWDNLVGWHRDRTITN